VLSPWRPRGSEWGGVIVVCVQLFFDPLWTSGGVVVL